MAKATLKLDGRQFELCRHNPVLEKLTAFLDSLPVDELVTASELTRRKICGTNTLSRHALILAPYRQAVNLNRITVVYGNKKAIIAVRKILKKENGES